MASVQDPTEIPGDPNLESLMMTEEERDFETFALASPSVPKRKTSWRASQENTKFYSQAQQVHRQDDSFTSQAWSLESQALARDQVDQVQGQAQPMLGQAQASVQDQPVSQAQFPVLLPEGQCRGDIDSLYWDENFTIDLDKKAALREKQACSEALDRVAEFCKLDRQDTKAKKEIMGIISLGMGIATKKCIAIYCDKHGCIAIRITIYWGSVKSKI